MSVFGGDSWGREAQYRKRRIEEVVIDGVDASSYKKLSTGKYACLVCPHNPILDTPLMLSREKGGNKFQNRDKRKRTYIDHMHCKGSRHLASESKMKEKELMKRDEINKRIALSNSPTTSINSSTKQNTHLASKPLIQVAQKAASEILGEKTRPLFPYK
ncbi:hypothetical protein DITRI_Ditri08aG0115200 [Diplodiscus trichospermus]